jgi:hypothetical protein
MLVPRRCGPVSLSVTGHSQRCLGDLEENLDHELWEDMGPYQDDYDEETRKEEYAEMFKWTCCGKPGDDYKGCVKGQHEAPESGKRTRLD